MGWDPNSPHGLSHSVHISVPASLFSAPYMARPVRSPDESLHCLLIQPQFMASNFWNLTESAATTGAKTVAPPLGLLTVAALLPQNWTFKLVDLNVRDLTDDEWNAADIICTGGMIPQQTQILELIDRANRDGKYVVVGGPDPTSQPEIYERADTRVLGEGEATIPMWLDSWRRGEPCGVFETDVKPDVSKSPLPRFDLVDFSHYLHAGIQISAAVRSIASSVTSSSYTAEFLAAKRCRRCLRNSTVWLTSAIAAGSISLTTTSSATNDSSRICWWNWRSGANAAASHSTSRRKRR